MCRFFLVASVLLGSLFPARAALLPASGLQASAQSAGSVQLTWKDPNGDETGFHVQRSADGTTFAPIANVGPNVASYLDASVQLQPATLYFYRVVAFSGVTDAAPSNVAAATTVPSTAAKVCATQVSEYHALARFPSAAWNGTEWAVAWTERSGGANEAIAFQRLDASTLALSGPRKLVTAIDAQAVVPTLRWNGSAYGLLYHANVRGADGVPMSGSVAFALLDAAGNKLRGDVRVTGANLVFGSDLQRPLVWNGGSWGVFAPVSTGGPTDLTYIRLAGNGDPMGAPVALTSTPNDWDYDVWAAWNGSVYGVAWIARHDTTYAAWFQRVQADGTKLGSPTLLFAPPPGDGLAYVDVVPDGTGFAIAFGQAAADGNSFYVRLARVDAAGALLGTPQRISDDGDVDDETPQIVPKPGGGFLVFTSSGNPTFSFDAAVLHADASGNRTGALAFLTAEDGRHDVYTRVATDGSSTLVAYNANDPGTLEVGALRADASGVLAAGPVLTSGHEAGNAMSFQTSGTPAMAPLGAGFVAAWMEVRATANEIHAALVDGAGAVSTKRPLTARLAGSRPALASAGSTFAIAFIDPTPAVYFQRFDAAGAAVTSEILVSSANPRAGKGISMDFSGEAYGVAWFENNHVVFQKVAPNGALVGSKVSLATIGAGNPGNHNALVQWTGTGWGILWRVDQNGGELYYAFIDAAGNVVVPALQVTFSSLGLGAYFFVWNGSEFGLVRNDFLGLDPPGADVYYTRLGIDGFALGPDVTLLSTPLGDNVSGLRWELDRYKLLYAATDRDGLRELDVMPNGTTGASRLLSPRLGAAASAWNGAAVGLAWLSQRELTLETDACLADATAPPCPAANASYDGTSVNLTWTASPDPESGPFRHLVYRDGGLLAEAFAATTSFADGGAPPGLHAYEVRAMNGAFQESAGCAVLPVSTRHGDANGDGSVTVSDVFWLINSLFAAGPSPLGFSDANGDHAVDVLDVFYLINYLFAGGDPPV